MELRPPGILGLCNSAHHWGRWQEADREPRHVLDHKAWHLVPPGFLMLQPPPGMDAGAAADLPQIWLQVLTWH